MRKLLAAVPLLAGLCLPAHASVITFEDLFIEPDSCEFWPVGCGMRPVPDGYSGFHWTEFAWVINKFSISPDTAYFRGTFGNMSLFTAYGSDIYMSMDGGTFDFNGAYLTAHDEVPYDLIVQGYRAGSLVYSKTVTITPWISPITNQPYFYTFNFNDVDQIGFVTNFRFVVIDDMQINEAFVEESLFAPIRRAVEGLLASGTLKSGNTNSLLVKLAAAAAAANRGDRQTALNNLDAFVYEVRALTGKKLSSEQGTNLISMAQDLAAAI